MFSHKGRRYCTGVCACVSAETRVSSKASSVGKRALSQISIPSGESCRRGHVLHVLQQPRAAVQGSCCQLGL